MSFLDKTWTTHENERQILETLGAPPRERARALDNVLFAVRTYRSHREQEERDNAKWPRVADKAAAPKRDIAKRLRAVGDSAAALREELELGRRGRTMWNAAEALLRALRDFHGDRTGLKARDHLVRQARRNVEIPHVLEQTLEGLLVARGVLPPDLLETVRVFEERAHGYQPRGRPEQRAIGILVNFLALEWERIHGEFPGRRVNRSYSWEEGPFWEFVRAVMKGIDPSLEPPDREIRRVIRGRKIMKGD
jgi:hypothetical protein